MADPNAPSRFPWLPPPDRLVIIAAACLAVFAAGLAVALYVLTRVQADSVRSGIQSRDMQAVAQRLTSAWGDAESGQLGYMLTNDAMFLEMFESGVAAAQTELSQLRTMAGADSDVGAAVVAAEQASERAISSLRQGVAMREGRRVNAANLRGQALASHDAMLAVHQANDDVIVALDRNLIEIRERNANARNAITWVSVILAVLALATSLITTWAVRYERRGWRAALAVMVRANQESEVARAKSAASDLAKTRFLAAASHDMRQPLHALTLYLSALQRRVQGQEALDILGKMERATYSMIGMFNTLLDLARIQADVVEAEIETVPLQDVIDRIVGEHPGADVAGPIPPTTLEVRTDQVLLERLLRNLVSNALRHGGGAVRIDAKPIGERVEIAVADDGPGIAPEDQQRIFDEFVRLDGRAGAEGLGLGLAIVKRIADLIGGEIALDSKLGAGARFMLRIPIARSTHAPAPTPAVASRGVAGMPILVMDDDPLALEAAAGVLRDLGAEVRACRNEGDVDSALRDGFAPKLLVMDLRVDGMLQGVDIAERARAKLSPPPPVIMVTGDTAPDTLGTLRQSGHTWLIKPVSRDDLAAAVAEAHADAT